ncbi:CbtA family protein [Propionibacterium sp.]|uniref:CbtA family protein n=1 Tax=Propionibacterium sp. TaxID=1977903 RepID=UPI0039E94065
MIQYLSDRKIFLTGAVSGAIAGFLAFIFARILVEPQIQLAIDYEGARDEVMDHINDLDAAAGIKFPEPGPDIEIFSRGIQRNIGIATGMVLMGLAFGLLIAVAFRIVLKVTAGQPPLTIRMTLLVIGLLGWISVFVVPALKYPPNPPAIGHSWTIHQRGNLYLLTVVCSVVFMILAAYLARRLSKSMDTWYAVIIAGACYVTAMCILFAILPSLGSLAQNTQYFGTEVTYGSGDSAVTIPITTETPLAATDPSGAILFPGFPADVLSRFRMYSFIAQAIIWLGASVIMGSWLSRMPGRKKNQSPAKKAAPAGV